MGRVKEAKLIAVFWPSGKNQILENVATESVLKIEEPKRLL